MSPLQTNAARPLAPPRPRTALALLLLAATIAGCATAPPRAPEVRPWDARRSELQALEQFELRGRVAVAAGEEGFNARMRWQQQGPQSEVALDGPLGVGGVQVASDGSALTVRNSRGEQLDSEAARAELQTRLGFDPPLSSLRYWILGVPDPRGPASEVVDEQQRLAKLEQYGWQVDYGAYEAVGEHWFPERLTLRGGDVRVRLVIDRWNP